MMGAEQIVFVLQQLLEGKNACTRQHRNNLLHTDQHYGTGQIIFVLQLEGKNAGVGPCPSTGIICFALINKVQKPYNVN